MSVPFLELSLKSSASFFFPVGDGLGMAIGVRSSTTWTWLIRGVPEEKLVRTGVFPRDGVKSAAIAID